MKTDLPLTLNFGREIGRIIEVDDVGVATAVITDPEVLDMLAYRGQLDGSLHVSFEVPAASAE